MKIDQPIIADLSNKETKTVLDIGQPAEIYAVDKWLIPQWMILPTKTNCISKRGKSAYFVQFSRALTTGKEKSYLSFTKKMPFLFPFLVST